MTSYDATPARHSVTGALVKGARGTLHTEADYAASDWGSPVSVVPVGGSATTELVADAYGLFPQFDDPAQSTSLIFRDLEGGHVQRIYSVGWLRQEIETRLSDPTMDARFQRRADYGNWPVVEPTSEGTWPTRASILPAGYTGRVHWVSIDYVDHVDPPTAAVRDVHTFRAAG